MHRTQVMLEEHQYERLRAESKRSGRSLGELIRDAIEKAYGADGPADLREALKASRGAWSERKTDGAAYVERLRPGLGRRLRELGWE